MWIDGTDVRLPDGGTAPAGDSWLLVLHAGPEDTPVTLPDPSYGAHYELVLDTATPDGSPSATEPLPARSVVTMPARTIRLYRTRS
jgi:isoamylase